MHPSHGHTGRGLRYPSMVPVKSDDRKGLEKNKIVPGVSVYRSLGKELNWEGETAVLGLTYNSRQGKKDQVRRSGTTGLHTSAGMRKVLGPGS